MKMLLKFALVFASLAMLSCSSDDDSQLALTIKSSDTALINAGTRSCVASKTANSANDIATMYFSILNPVITWSNPSATAYIDTVVIKLKSDNFTGGEQKCTISTSELIANYFSGTPTTTVISIAPGTSQTLTPTCSFICGSISLVDQNRAFSAVGQIEVRGYQVDTSTSESQSIKATSYFSLQYTPQHNGVVRQKTSQTT